MFGISLNVIIYQQKLFSETPILSIKAICD